MAKVSAAAIITRHAKQLRKARDHVDDLVLTTSVATSVTASPGELREVAEAARAVMKLYGRIRDQVVAEVPGSIMAAILADAHLTYELLADEWAHRADQAAKRTGGTP